MTNTTHSPSAPRPTSGDPVVAHELTKTFGDGAKQPKVEVLKGISLAVGAGEFVAIVGPSGSGKSTLLYCLSSLERPTSGTVKIAGHELAGQSRRSLAQLRLKHIGFVFQQFNLIPSLNARNNASLPARLSGHRDALARADAALEAVGLATRAKHLPGMLSGGEQQRVALARVLATDPNIVFADEPTGSLDAQSSDTILGLLRKTASGKRAVVMVTHDLAGASRADRVLVMRDGHIHAELVTPSAEQIWQAMAVPETSANR